MRSRAQNDAAQWAKAAIRYAFVGLFLLSVHPVHAQISGDIRALPPQELRPLPPLTGLDSQPESMAPPAPGYFAIPSGEAEFQLASQPPGYRPAEDVLAETPLCSVTDHKNGFFQKLSLNATQVVPDGSDGLGILETELFAAFALPAPTTESPLVLAPSLNMQFLSGPTYVDLPPRLIAPYVDFIWLPRFGPRLRGLFSVTPGWYSDFEGSESESFRLTGQAILRYDWVADRLQWVLGLLYLNRHDNEVIPAAGLIWTPNDDANYEMVFPRVKLARRIGCGPAYEHWIYLLGTFGGNDWIVTGETGTAQRMVLRDWRVSLGWERKMDGGAAMLAELGYVFSREIEFVATGAEYRPDDTLLLRAGFAY